MVCLIGLLDNPSFSLLFLFLVILKLIGFLYIKYKNVILLLFITLYNNLKT